MQNIIFNTDGGSDDVMALLLALGLKDKINLLGITTVHGNVTLDQASNNIMSALTFANRTDIPVYKGSEQNLMQTITDDDNAHGADGMGGVKWPNNMIAQENSALEFMIDTLDKLAPQSIALVCCGPLTDIAHIIMAHESALDRAKEIIILGGCRTAFDAKGYNRQGNITPHAEFNAFKDPHAFDIVMQYISDNKVKATILPIDAIQGVTQDKSTGMAVDWNVKDNFVMTPKRLAWLSMIHPDVAKLANAAFDIDTSKWGAEGAFLFDPMTIAYLAFPEHFVLRDGNIKLKVITEGERAGNTSMEPANSQISGLDRLRDVDDLFAKCVEGWQNALPHLRYNPAPKPLTPFR